MKRSEDYRWVMSAAETWHVQDVATGRPVCGAKFKVLRELPPGGTTAGDDYVCSRCQYDNASGRFAIVRVPSRAVCSLCGADLSNDYDAYWHRHLALVDEYGVKDG